MGLLYITLLTRLGHHVRRGRGKIIRTRSSGHLQWNCFLKNGRTIVHINSQQCIHKIKPAKIPTWMGGGSQSSTPNWGDISNWWLLGMKLSSGMKPPRACPCPYTHTQKAVLRGLEWFFSKQECPVWWKDKKNIEGKHCRHVQNSKAIKKWSLALQNLLCFYLFFSVFQAKSQFS